MSSTGPVPPSTAARLQVTPASILTTEGYCVVHQTPPLLKDGEKRLFHPALAKQLGFKLGSEVDAKIVINSKMPIFPAKVPTWHPRHHYHFLRILSHEMVHALGFSSAYRPGLSALPCPELFPEMKGDAVLPKFYDYAFDRHVHINEKATLSNFTAELNSIASLSYAEYHDRSTFEKSIEYDHLQVLNVFLTTAREDRFIYFNASNRRIPLVVSSNPFQSGISLVHLSNPNPLDILMTHSNQASLEDLLLKADWPEAPYGPDTLAILQTLGYPINPTPDPALSMAHHYKTMLQDVQKRKKQKSSTGDAANQ